MEGEYYCIYKNDGKGVKPCIILRDSGNGVSVLEHTLGKDVHLHTRNISEEEYLKIVEESQ